MGPKKTPHLAQRQTRTMIVKPGCFSSYSPRNQNQNSSTKKAHPVKRVARLRHVCAMGMFPPSHGPNPVCALTGVCLAFVKTGHDNNSKRTTATINVESQTTQGGKHPEIKLVTSHDDSIKKIKTCRIPAKCCRQHSTREPNVP